MATIKSLNKWANAHTYYPLDLLRVALGVFLFIGNRLIDPLGSGGTITNPYWCSIGELFGRNE